MTLAWFASKTGNKSFFETDKFLQAPEQMRGVSRLAGISLVWMAQYEEKGDVTIPTEWKGDGPNPVVFFTGGEDDPNKYYFGGKGGRGKVSHGNMAGERPEATIDMTPTFSGQLKAASRKFIKDSARSLLIEDDIEISEDTDLITWQLITQADVEINRGGAILRQDGENLTLKILSHPVFTPSVISLDSPPLYLDTRKECQQNLDMEIDYENKCCLSR